MTAEFDLQPGAVGGVAEVLADLSVRRSQSLAGMEVLDELENLLLTAGEVVGDACHARTVWRKWGGSQLGRVGETGPELNAAC